MVSCCHPLCWFLLPSVSAAVPPLFITHLLHPWGDITSVSQKLIYSFALWLCLHRCSTHDLPCSHTVGGCLGAHVTDVFLIWEESFDLIQRFDMRTLWVSIQMLEEKLSPAANSAGEWCLIWLRWTVAPHLDSWMMSNAFSCCCSLVGFLQTWAFIAAVCGSSQLKCEGADIPSSILYLYIYIYFMRLRKTPRSSLDWTAAVSFNRWDGRIKSTTLWHFVSVKSRKSCQLESD